MGRLMLIGPVASLTAALMPGSDALPKPPGRMRVVLNVHGGLRGLARCLDGLVDRNARAVREGKVPHLEDADLRRDDGARAWKDAPMAMLEGYMGPFTEAAWYAGQLRAQGRQVAMGFRDGRPVVYERSAPDNLPRILRQWPQARPINLRENEGRSDERMVVTIDDDKATPVREINQAIAKHNAVRIREKRLPPLYARPGERPRVRYKPEGSPELWWDAEEILRNGFDDCEGLAAYRAGELMVQGYDARVWTRLVQMPSKEMGGSGKGGRLFHAVVRIVRGPDGQPVLDKNGWPAMDDPSFRLGMKVPEWYKEFAAKMRAEGREL